jgi:hypothetical protein
MRGNQIVVHSRLHRFRHSGNQFKLRVYDVKNTVVAEFDVDDPSPDRGQYPVWTPETLPATASDGDVNVTLKGLIATKAERQVDSIKSPTLSLYADFQITQAGQPAPYWTRQNMTISDAVGNESPMWDCQLCPSESAWKLKLRLFRNEFASFDSSEQWSVSNIEVPAAGMIKELNETDMRQQLRISLLSIAGPGRTTHYGLTQPTDGSWGYVGSFSVGEKQLQCEINTVSQGGAASTTVQCELFHLAAQVTDLSDEYYAPDLLAVDDQGRKINVQPTIRHASGTFFWFMEIPSDARTLDLTFLVQKGRLFEFIVKPPNVEPTELFQRADELARRSQFSEAAAEFAHALDVYPENHWQWYRSVCLQAQIQDRDAYRKQCARMLELFDNTDNPNIAERTAKACLLWPEHSSEDTRLTALADRAIAKEPDNAWFRLAKGIAEYRAARIDSCLTWLTNAQQAPGNNTYSTSLAQLFQAMAQQKLGQVDSARETLHAVIEVLNRIQASIDPSALESGWHDWLICQIVRREAEQLLQNAE